MKTAALVLGILGGLAGLVGGFLAFLAGGFVSAVGDEGTGSIMMNLSWVVFVSSLVGLIGAGVVSARPKLAALLMILAAVTGFILVGGFYILGAPLLAIGALLAFLGRDEQKTKA